MTKTKVFSSFSWLVVIICLLGGFLRIYKLSEIPVGFHIDEAQVGYNAFSLWKTGRDETGKFLPTHLTLWKVDRPLAVSYLTIPGIMVFGLNEFGTRLPTAIMGTLTILLVYFLTREIFNNKKLAIISCFLLAISPWHIMLSRATSEAVMSLFFYVLGILYCYKAKNKSSYRNIIWAYLALIGSFFLYHSTRITIPFIFLFFSLQVLKINRKLSLLFILFLCIYLVFPLATYSKTSLDRFKLVSLFNTGETKLVLEEQIREDGTGSPALVSRIFHNKPVNYSMSILENFASYFSYSFLVAHGGLPIRYNLPNMGLIYLWELPFIIWGFFILFKKQTGKNITGIVVLWLILGSLAASLTVEESPNLNRALFVLPALQWLTALGLRECYQLITQVKQLKIPVGVLLMGFFIWNFFYFWHQYTVHSYTHKPWFRFYEMKEVVNIISKEKEKYKTVYLSFNSTEPYIFFLFYNKVDPIKWQKNREEKGLDYVWNNIDNIKIIRKDCPIIPDKEKPKSLGVYKISCKFPKGVRIVKKFSYPDKETPLVAVDFPMAFSKTYQELNYEKKTEPLNY